MKKLVLFSVALAAMYTAATAQEAVKAGVEPDAPQMMSERRSFTTALANKITGPNDSLVGLASDSFFGGSYNIYYEFAQPLDSGFVYGVNPQGYKGVAMLYYTNLDRSGNNDTTLSFRGWYSRWGGRVQTTSTKQVTFSFWSRGTDKTAVAGRNKFYLYGKPSTLLTSKQVLDTGLKASTGSAVITWAAAPVSNITKSTYVGVTYNHTWATTGTDTFGLRSTQNISASREPNFYDIQTGTLDTLLNTSVLIQNNSGTWVSHVYDLKIGVGDPLITPIYDRKIGPASVGGVTYNDLTFVGSFPNPAATVTNFKVSLAKATSLTATVYDYSGRQITVRKMDLGTGEHILPVEVSNFTAGTYICLFETASGDRIAGAFEVRH